MADPGITTLRRLNRSVAVISPKVPFLEWSQQCYGDKQPPPGMANQPRAFLIPNTTDDREGFDYIQVICGTVFAEMLGAWNPDRASWPADLDSSVLFTAWFDVQVVPAIFDQDSDEPILAG